MSTKINSKVICRQMFEFGFGLLTKLAVEAFEEDKSIINVKIIVIFMIIII